MRLSAILALCLVVSTLAPLGAADDLATAGRDLVGKWQQAVVTLEVTVKMQHEGEAYEDQNEQAGTLVDPAGLVVTALSTLDPTDLYTQMMSEAGEREAANRFTSEITALKIRLPDGRQLPAKVVLRDKDLDLAFIRPTAAPEQPLTALSLAAAGKPALLDQVIVIERLGAAANRVAGATVDRVKAVLDKPRTFYVLAAMDVGSLGMPVFTADGGLVGILALRTINRQAAGLSSRGEGMLPVVIPASDIAEVAKQAPEK